MAKTLDEILQSLASLDRKKTICAEKINGKWLPESKAWLVPKGKSLPDYFLEVDIALEVLDGWSRYQIKHTPTHDEIVSRIIYYATYDA